MDSFSMNWDSAGQRVEVKQLSNIKEDDTYQKKRDSLELSRALQEYTTQKEDIYNKSTDSKSIFWSELESVVSSDEERKLEEGQVQKEEEKPKTKYSFLEKIQRKIKLLKQEREKAQNAQLPKTSSEERFLKFKKINSKLQKPPIYLPIRKLLQVQKPPFYQEKLISAKQYPNTQRLTVPSVSVQRVDPKRDSIQSKMQSYNSNRSTRFETQIISGNISKMSKDGQLPFSRPHTETKLAQAIYMKPRTASREIESARFLSQTSKLQLRNLKRGTSEKLKNRAKSQLKNRNYSSVTGLLDRYLSPQKDESQNASIEQLQFFKQPEGYVSCSGFKKPDTQPKQRRKMRTITIFDRIHVQSRQAMDTMDARGTFF